MSVSLRRLPGDPSDLYLRIAFRDDLEDTPSSETLERWEVTIHQRGAHDGPGAGRAARGERAQEHSAAVDRDDGTVGQMTFYRVHPDRGMNAWLALTEASEDLAEIARAVLDPDTGNFTTATSHLLEYAGVDLLVMDRVHLARDLRGHGLGAMLACEAIYRLMPGCRAVACSPGLSDHDREHRIDQSEWDRVLAQIAKGWERVGFRHYEDNVYLLSPASELVEEQRSVLRREFAELGAAWRASAARGQAAPRT
ncbi:hypothetical protein [Streptomyces sp. NPDC046925]|uniref:hypothetical protein n=1 Tax=Streptomyces sp. NPDC046925 TaxID=3155375 RepID=UPI0033CF48C7